MKSTTMKSSSFLLYILSTCPFLASGYLATRKLSKEHSQINSISVQEEEFLNPIQDDLWWAHVYHPSLSSPLKKTKKVVTTDMLWKDFIAQQQRLAEAGQLHVINDDAWWAEVFKQPAYGQTDDEYLEPELNSVELNPINDEAWWLSVYGKPGAKPRSHPSKIAATETELTWEQFLAAQERLKEHGNLNPINDEPWWDEVFGKSLKRPEIRFIYPKLLTHDKDKSKNGPREVVMI